MNNYFIFKLNTIVVSFALLTFIGFSKEGLSYTNAYKKYFVQNTFAKNSEGSCSAAVNFGDLEIETSYNTGVINHKNQYVACSVDGESWMVRYTDKRVKLQCLRGDGHHTELKEDTGY